MAIEAKGSIKAIYLHWTAGHYHQAYDDYHLNIDEDGTIYCTCNSLREKKAHTYKRNTGAIGITLCCAYDASLDRYDYRRINFGPEPPTPQQFKTLAWVLAILCEELGLELKWPYVLTHAEIAIHDGYGPQGNDPDMRWDLYFLHDPADNLLRLGGPLLREMAQKIMDERTPRKKPPSSGNNPPPQIEAIQIPLIMA